VTVTVNAPVVAVLEADNVSTLLVPVVVVVAGLKLAVTPVGNPLAVKDTAPAKLLRRVTVMVLVPLAPCATLSVAGLADKEKSAVAVEATVKATDVVWVREPLVPVIVTVAAPKVAVLEAVRVSVLLVPVTDAGLKLAVTPLGKPLAVMATVPVNPPVRVIVMVLVPLAPRFTVRLDGLAERLKLGLAPPPPKGNWIVASRLCLVEFATAS
jgi:hypothetical protein